MQQSHLFPEQQPRDASLLLGSTEKEDAHSSWPSIIVKTDEQVHL